MPTSPGRFKRGDPPRRRCERLGILGVDPALDGVALDGHRLLDNLGQLVTRRDQDLALHQIDSGDGFGDRMLHLNARVHFDEVEIAIAIHQKFDGAGIGVADLRHGRAQPCAHHLP